MFSRILLTSSLSVNLALFPQLLRIKLSRSAMFSSVMSGRWLYPGMTGMIAGTLYSFLFTVIGP